MADLDRIAVNNKLFRGLTMLDLRKNGVHFQGLGPLTAYTSTGHLKFGQHKIDEEEWAEQAEKCAKNVRILMVNGVWLVPPEDRPQLRPDLTYPT